MSGDEQSVAYMIRAARIRRGETLRVVAAAVDMDSTLLSKLERGERLPTQAQAERLAEHLGLPFHEFLAISIADRILREHGSTYTVLKATEIVRNRLTESHDDEA